MIQELTKQTFNDFLKSDRPVLVDFWATWCGPCRMLAPTVEALSEEWGEEVTVGKVDVDKEEELALQFGVMSIPTLLLFKDGKEVSRLVGLQPEEAIRQCVENAK